MTRPLAVIHEAMSRAGYSPDLMEDGPSWISGFARLPRTARNACVVALGEGGQEGLKELAQATGAPVLLLVEGEDVGVWRASPTGVTRVDELRLAEFEAFTERARALIEPVAIHRARTTGRFDGRYQLELVDVGLLQHVEAAQGRDLRRLLERIVAELRAGVSTVTEEHGHQLLTIAFWILAARMLRDHGVPGFVALSPEGRPILEAVARHYSGAVPLLAFEPDWVDRVDRAAGVAWRSGLRLDRVGPEAIGYVYESALIAKQTRKDLGTHSTPPYLVEYVLGRLHERILAIPPERRSVVEPASGHGAFLVAALRVLAEEVPAGRPRHEYLRANLHGVELDHGALELARLSLTIADVPNPDGWDLREGDLFLPGVIEELARGATLLLANPPFEDFKAEDRERLAKLGAPPLLVNKTAELLRRALPALAEDALIGVVVPKELLRDRGARALRRALLDRCELLEVCTFPDSVFRFADHECAVILAAGAKGGTRRTSRVLFRRVREADLAAFEQRFEVSSEETVPGSVFLDHGNLELVVPELRRLWVSRAWRTLGEIATVQQGLSYHGWVRQSGHETVRELPFDGSVPGLASPGRSRDLGIMDPPLYCHMDATPAHVMSWRGGRPTGRPQVVLNTHPKARGPWRLLAHIDPRGAAVPSTRIVVRPRDPSTPIELLWAICNSPMASAYVYAHLGKRDVTTGPLSRLPIPTLLPEVEAGIVALVRELFDASARRDATTTARHLARLDALLLGAYGLFAPEEQLLVDLFRDQPRPGLPFESSSIGAPSRLPQHLLYENLPLILGPLPDPGSDALQPDVEQSIADGHRELAELRRRELDGGPRVRARARQVRSALARLERHAADRWIPDFVLPSFLDRTAK